VTKQASDPPSKSATIRQRGARTLEVHGNVLFLLAGFGFGLEGLEFRQLSEPL
jgi:hypothetical protein